MKKIKINYSILIVILITWLFGFLRQYLFMFLILFMHEAAHLLVMAYKEIGISQIKIDPFGINIRTNKNLIKEPDKEILTSLAGPFINILSAFFVFVLVKDKPFNRDISFFMGANLSIGFFNLLPVFPLDGGRALKAALSKKIGYLKSYRFVLVLTRVISIFLIAAGGYILYKTKFNFSVCLIGSFLLFNVLLEKNHTYYYLVWELSEYKKKNRHIEKMPVKYLAVKRDFPLRKILNELSFNKYHIIIILEGGRKIGSFTEGELMECLIKKGSKAKACDLYQ